jgi:hypothetical protein
MFKTLFTDIQEVYRDAQQEMSRSLEKFEKSLQEAGLLLITRVDANVLKIRNELESTNFLRTVLNNSQPKTRQSKLAIT